MEFCKEEIYSKGISRVSCVSALIKITGKKRERGSLRYEASRIAMFLGRSNKYIKMCCKKVHIFFLNSSSP